MSFFRIPVVFVSQEKNEYCGVRYVKLTFNCAACVCVSPAWDVLLISSLIWD